MAGVEEAEELDDVGIAIGVGLVLAGDGVVLPRLEAEPGAGELAGVVLAVGVAAAEVSADFWEREFLALPLSAALVLALSAVSADFLDRPFFAVVEESAALETSAESADFVVRVFFFGVASVSDEAAVASVESALLFFERLFFVPVSDAESSAAGRLPAASGDFLPFFAVDLLLSAVVELSVESALALFFERLFLPVEPSVAELSALSALFFFDLDLAGSAAESPVDCCKSSALAFFLDFFLGVELSL